ncbi:sugar transferase [Erythrobacter sp. MTPC3]|uniref:sugar transferase n=1 Tax=Erythrobacter sp. MTPC3 TaxID=3056564 RepID=UPI0036F20C4D
MSVFSRLVALLILVVAAPFLILLAIAVLVMQGRPVLFRQMRAGKDRVPFELVKFRSMRDTRGPDGELLPDEMRTTAIGKFLRRSRLDELLGLWNVARGDMNFVGPRPLLPETIAELGALGNRRSEVKPGLTGWSQVSGNTLLTLEQKVALDIWYIDNRGPVLDAQILARTVLVMVGGEKVRVETPTGDAP